MKCYFIACDGPFCDGDASHTDHHVNTRAEVLEIGKRVGYIRKRVNGKMRDFCSKECMEKFIQEASHDATG